MLGKEATTEVLSMKPADLRDTARVNLMQGSRKEILENLATENIRAKPLAGVPEGIEITNGAAKLGSSLSYLRGEVMPQGLGSMLTVLALDPKPGEFIIDMAAAPGGKSCFIAERMQGEGRLLSNDSSTVRYRSLLFNLARHHLSNVVFSNQDGQSLKETGVNRILLDAPCTGGGLLVSKPERRTSRRIDDSIQLQRLQTQLLRQALNMLEPGGICVYSTCAVSPIENEMVVERFQDLVEFQSLSIDGRNAYIESQQIGKRLYPHENFCDGFFIVKMVKI